MNEIIKKKYIFFNEDYKILIFKAKSKFLFPTIVASDRKNINNENYKKIIDICSNGERPCRLSEIIKNECYYNGNNEFGIKEQYIKRYYAMYHDFSEKYYLEIFKLALRKRLTPYMATIDEIRNLIAERKFDVMSLEALKVLEEEINYDRKKEYYVR